MPYIITTRAYATSSACPRLPAPRHRRAVATLDEAREAALAVVRMHTPPTPEWLPNAGHILDAGALLDHGGTVGPLPDGAVIEVERVDWHAIGDAIEAAGICVDTLDGSAIDAYNAAQEG